MAERRQLQRYELNIPALITDIPDVPEYPETTLMTRDISASGAFFDTSRPLAQGCVLSLELQLPGRDHQRGRVQLKGTVVRSTPVGMAVSFDDDYRFLAVGEDEGMVEN
ncbi:MAG: PilZ domain-containing protein [Pseudomonadota bacterium]|nr:PilZ domain-containing protein [Pseudomonadota bacterium]